MKCSFKNACTTTTTARLLGEAHWGRQLPPGSTGDGTNGCHMYYDADDVKLQFSSTVADISYNLGGPSQTVSWSYSYTATTCTPTVDTQTFTYKKGGVVTTKPTWLTQTGTSFTLAVTTDTT